MPIFYRKAVYFYQNLHKNVTNLNVFFETCVFKSAVLQIK